MKKRIVWALITALIITVLKFSLISKVNSIQEGIIICNHYINMNNLIDISSNLIFIFPLLILLMYVITIINGIMENYIFIATRLGAKRKYVFKIFTILIKETFLVLLYFYIFEVIGIVFISGTNIISIPIIIYSFIQYSVILLIYSLLFSCCRLYQNYNLGITISLLSLSLVSITGFWAQFMGNVVLREMNFIVNNSVFDLKKTNTLVFMNNNGFIVLISVIIISIYIFSKKEA